MPEAHAQETARCYKEGRLAKAAEKANIGLTRVVAVLVDRTTDFPADVQQAVIEQVSALVEPGTQTTVGAFSSYTDQAHSQIVFESFLEPELSRVERADVMMSALDELDDCLSKRAKKEHDRLVAALSPLLETSQTDVQRSDIMGNLKKFGLRLNGSPAEDKVAFLVSDMLENSSDVSFYRNKSMRRIDPAVELARVEKYGLFSDLRGTRIYVIGAGLAKPGTKVYRDQADVRALEAFWIEYFRRSGAKRTEVGTPLLLKPVS